MDKLGYTSAFPNAVAVDKNNKIIVALSGTVVKSVISFDRNRWEEITRPDNMRDLKALAFEGDKIWVGGSGRGSMDGNTDK